MQLGSLFEEVLGRIKQIAKVQTDTEVAKILGLTRSAITAARKRKTIPTKWIVYFTREYKIRPEWLLYGHGEAQINVDEQLTDYDEKLRREEFDLRYLIYNLHQRISDIKSGDEKYDIFQDYIYKFYDEFLIEAATKIEIDTGITHRWERGNDPLSIMSGILIKWDLDDLIMLEGLIKEYIIFRKEFWERKIVKDEYPYIKN